MSDSKNKSTNEDNNSENEEDYSDFEDIRRLLQSIGVKDVQAGV